MDYETQRLYFIHHALKSNSNINDTNENNSTALHMAVEINNPDAVQKLLSAGANPNLQDNYGLTPLHLAAFYNNKEIVPILIKGGANVNVKDGVMGRTPLHFAIDKFMNPDIFMIISDLLEAGADINTREDWFGRSILHLAIEENPKIIPFLIEKNADVSIKDINGDTALDYAEKTRVRSMILSPNLDKNICDSDGFIVKDLSDDIIISGQNMDEFDSK